MSRALWLAALAACGFPKPADIPECTTSADCTTRSAPFCVAGACVAACQSSADCTDRADAPFCQTSTGACVACLDATACAADKPVCDATAGSCRGCARDEECAAGICVEADGTCVADRDVLFVDGLGGRDTGTCTRTAPCGTLGFAISAAGAASQIHLKILGGTFRIGASVTLYRQLYLEGSDTIVSGPTGMFGLLQGANVTLSHVKLQPSAAGAVISVGTTQTLRLFDVQTTGSVGVNGGSLDAEQSTFSNAGGITCSAGTLSVLRTTFDDSQLTAMTCAVTVRRSRFDLPSDANRISIEGGVLAFENNLIVQADGIADSMAIGGQAAGSTVAFNTFVNTTPLPSDGVALNCGSGAHVSSNIFAYNSMHPLVQCDARYSLLDTTALPEFATGVGSKQADSTTFFVDKPGRDFHLSTSSPAQASAETGLDVTEDFDGSPRPSPPGSVPDIGAFEAR